MLKFFIIQAIVILVLGSCIYTLITGKDITNDGVWITRLGIAICVLSLIEFLVIMIMGFIYSIIDSKPVKTKTSDDWDNPIKKMSYENQSALSAQLSMSNGRFWRNVPGREPPSGDPSLPPCSPPSPPPPPPPPMPPMF